MAFDLTGVVTYITPETVIFATLAFIAGMAGVISYHRLRPLFKRTEYHADDSIAEAVITEYSRRLRDYDRVIAELRAKVDIMELRSETPRPAVMSQPQPSQQPQPHVARVTQVTDITQPAAVVDVERHEGQNGTTDYILKMLSERPRTSREVQQAIGRSREHTSRLMKKLLQSGLVARDADTKPFRYAVTEQGRGRLREKAGVASELRNP
jgi:hypothetical protein